MRLSSFDKTNLFSVYKTRTIENHRKIIEGMCKKTDHFYFFKLITY